MEAVMVIYWYLTDAVCHVSVEGKSKTTPTLHPWANLKLEKLAKYLHGHNAKSVDGIVVHGVEIATPVWLDLALSGAVLTPLLGNAKVQIVNSPNAAAEMIREMHVRPDKTVIVIGNKQELVDTRQVFGNSRIEECLTNCKVGDFVRQTRRHTKTQLAHWDIR